MISIFSVTLVSLLIFAPREIELSEIFHARDSANGTIAEIELATTAESVLDRSARQDKIDLVVLDQSRMSFQELAEEGDFVSFSLRRGDGIVRFFAERDGKRWVFEDGIVEDPELSSEIPRQADYGWPLGEFDAVYAGFFMGRPIWGEGGLFEGAVVSGEGRATAQNRFGSGTVELDLYSKLPKRIEWTISPDSLWFDKKLGDRVMGGGKMWPSGKIKKMECVLDVQIANGQVEGWTKSVKAFCDADGIVVTSIDRCVVKDVRSASQLTDCFLVATPEVTTPVQVTGAAHLPYIWDGEWAVPVSEFLAARGYQARTLWPRISLGATLVLSLIAIGYFVFQRQKGLE